MSDGQAAPATSDALAARRAFVQRQALAYIEAKRAILRERIDKYSTRSPLAG